MVFLKFGQEKKRNYTKIVSLLVFKARSDAVWVYNWGTLPLNLALRREGLYSMWRCALMQYGSVIGARSRRPRPAKGRTVFIDEARSDAVWVYNWGTLPLTSPS